MVIKRIPNSCINLNRNIFELSWKKIIPVQPFFAEHAVVLTEQLKGIAFCPFYYIFRSNHFIFRASPLASNAVFARVLATESSGNPGCRKKKNYNNIKPICLVFNVPLNSFKYLSIKRSRVLCAPLRLAALE